MSKCLLSGWKWWWGIKEIPPPPPFSPALVWIENVREKKPSSNLPVNVIVKLPHLRNFAPSADNQNLNYDTECSNHHPSLLLKLTDKIVYKAQVENNDAIKELSTKVNFGVSETELKFKYNSHTMSFRNRTHGNDPKLSKFIWSLKDQNKEFDIQWSIFKKNFRIKIVQPLPLEKASSKQFQRGEVTPQVIKSCVEMQAWK